MHPLTQDGTWYDMDAGFLHTAANFGHRHRIQLVVRKLLKKNQLTNPVDVVLTTNMTNADHARHIFDNRVSPWLNEANKAGYIGNFSHSSTLVKFSIEQDKLDELKYVLPDEFQLA
jgi:hypothetical protein